MLMGLMSLMMFPVVGVLLALSFWAHLQSFDEFNGSDNNGLILLVMYLVRRYLCAKGCSSDVMLVGHCW